MAAAASAAAVKERAAAETAAAHAAGRYSEAELEAKLKSKCSVFAAQTFHRVCNRLRQRPVMQAPCQMRGSHGEHFDAVSENLRATSEDLQQLGELWSLKTPISCRGPYPVGTQCPMVAVASFGDLLRMQRDDADDALVSFQMDHSLQTVAVIEANIAQVWQLPDQYMDWRRVRHLLYGVYSFGVMPPAVVIRCKSCHEDWREKHNTGGEIKISSASLPAGLVSRRWGEVGAFEATEYSRQLLERLDAAVDTVGGWGEGGVSLSLMGAVFHSSTTAKKLVPPCVSQLRSWVHLVRGDREELPLAKRAADAFEPFLEQWLETEAVRLSSRVGAAGSQCMPGPIQREVCGENGCQRPPRHNGLCSVDFSADQATGMVTTRRARRDSLSGLQ